MASVSAKVTPHLVHRKTQTTSCSPSLQLQSSRSRFPRQSLTPSNPSLFFNSVRSSRCSVISRAATFETGDIADSFDQVSIFTASGESVMLKDLLGQNEEIAVVSLLRHFGCPCCWELASALKEAKARFDSANVKLIAIGVGGPDKARILAERLPFPMDCLYADPERKAYDVLGLYHGFGRTFFNPASVKSAFLSQVFLDTLWFWPKILVLPFSCIGQSTFKI
ncbi:hypothetical protein AgCh_004277 [Apium graveolens]